MATVTLVWPAGSASNPITNYRIYEAGVQVAEVGNVLTTDLLNVTDGNKSYTVTTVDDQGNESAQSPVPGVVTVVTGGSGNFFVNTGGDGANERRINMPGPGNPQFGSGGPWSITIRLRRTAGPAASRTFLGGSPVNALWSGTNSILWQDAVTQTWSDAGLATDLEALRVTPGFFDIVFSGTGPGNVQLNVDGTDYGAATTNPSAPSSASNVIQSLGHSLGVFHDFDFDRLVLDNGTVHTWEFNQGTGSSVNSDTAVVTNLEAAAGGTEAMWGTV